MVKSMSLKAAIRDTFQIFQFDQWLRFYFVVQKDDKLFMDIPEETLKRIEADYPGLFTLAETVNETEIDYQRSQDTVCSHVAAHLDGAKYDASVLPKVFDAPQFKIEMYVLNVWMKLHEAHLDETPVYFDEWMEMYTEWNKLDQVREYRAKLEQGGAASMDPSCSTRQ